MFDVSGPVLVFSLAVAAAAVIGASVLGSRWFIRAWPELKGAWYAREAEQQDAMDDWRHGHGRRPF